MPTKKKKAVRKKKRQGRKPGRPTDSYEAQAEEVLKYLRLGMSRAEACRLATIGESTLSTWVSVGQGALEGGREWTFAKAVESAEDFAKKHSLEKITGSRDWRAHAWLLSVREPARFGQKVRVTLEQEFTDALERIRKRVSPDVYEQVLDAVLSGGSEEGEVPPPPGEESTAGS